MRPKGPLSGADGADLMVVGSAAQDVGEESRLRDGDGLTCSVELSGVLARCSLSHLYDVISGMGDLKQELVKEIGFGGLLYFPGIKQIDRKFAVWLMCRVDALAQTLLVGDGTKIKFNKDDIARIFGIPCRGRKVGEHGKPGRVVVSKIMSEYLNMNPKEFRSIKAVREIVDREYKVEMTKHEKDCFKVAFVMYVMSTMLVPGGRFDYVSIDYWDGLENADDICLYDWSDFVLRRLLDSVVKIKMDIKSRKKIPSITGCTLFLQVLYLDSVDLGVWTMEHNSFPRIRCFGPDRLKSMIRADTVKQTLDPKDLVFGRSKLLPVTRVCYSWAAEGQGIVTAKDSSSNKLALWRATILFARLIGFPVEACPRDFSQPLWRAVVPNVRMRGEAHGVHQVTAEFVGERIRFGGRGWSEFVAAEKLVTGDVCMFILVAPHMFIVKLFDAFGNTKPMEKRPPVWNRFIAYRDQVVEVVAGDNANAVAPGAGGLVPDYIRAINYVLGPGLDMSAELMERLTFLWLNFDTDYPLYAVRMNHSHIDGGHFYFKAAYSQFFPFGDMAIALFYADHDDPVLALARRADGEGLVRFTRGWRTFVDDFGVDEDAVYVFVVTEIHQYVYAMRVFRVLNA